MKRLISVVILTLLVCSCAVLPETEAQLPSQAAETKTEEQTVVKTEEPKEKLLYNPNDPSTYRIVAGEMVGYDEETGCAIEPDSRLDIKNMTFGDFGEFFTESFPVTVESYKIGEGEKFETTVYHIRSENPGPTVYIAAGIHGDERAAWYAGVLLKDATISCGDLYVLSQANIIGANRVSRRADAWDDPNRFFPGKADGTLTQRLDYAIFSDIKDKNPDILLDLHEAIVISRSRDFLGSTYIFTTLDEIDMLIFDMLSATQEGDICHNEFSCQGPGPEGSMNATVANELGIPAITVETFRGFDIYRRVYDQLDTVQFVLDYYGMR